MSDEFWDGMTRGARNAAQSMAWNQPTAQAATVDASAPTPPGEGHRTGTGGPDAPGASEGLDAAIEAARGAIRGYWAETGGWFRDSTYDGLAQAAVRAAEPLLRQAVAEELAANPVRWEYGIFQDRTADGLGHAFLATRHTREDALAAVDRLATEEPNYPAYAAKRSVRHGTWEPLDVAREIGARDA